MNSKLLALIGAAVTIIGLFLPVFDAFDHQRSPMSLNFLFRNGEPGGGVITLALAVMAILIALIDQTKQVLWVGLASLAYLIWGLLNFKAEVDEVASWLASFPPEQTQNLQVGLNYQGWTALFLGALLLIVAGAIAWRARAD